jgi:hypothetical protein
MMMIKSWNGMMDINTFNSTYVPMKQPPLLSFLFSLPLHYPARPSTKTAVESFKTHIKATPISRAASKLPTPADVFV